MLQLPMIGRAGDMSNFCFAYQDIEWPKDPTQIDGAGIPSYIFIILRRWKGNEKGLLPPQRLRISRNWGNAECCPIVALMTWLAVSGIRSGPIFPALTHGGGFVIHNVYNKADTYSGWMTKLFVYVGGGLAKCRGHSMRKSAVKWGVRCGESPHILVKAGRWVEGSKSFFDYLEEGTMMREEYLNSPDPIFKFWPWQRTTGSFS